VRARALGEAGQRRFLDGLLAEPWWQGTGGARVCRSRVPVDWGREFGLHADAMNPVMSARLMRRGRLAHRSPWVGGLYLAGATTHPGQWVSFAAISGVLAADRLRADRPR
jgi:phytoene dehydrogenase-like protein